MSYGECVLKKVPEEIQEIYNIGSEVAAYLYSGGVGGGSINLINLDGKEITLDAVELSGTGIEIHWDKPVVA